MGRRKPRGSLPGEFAVEVGRGDSAVHEEVAAGDERPVGAQEKRADGSDLVWSAAAPSPASTAHPGGQGQAFLAGPADQLLRRLLLSSRLRLLLLLRHIAWMTDARVQRRSIRRAQCLMVRPSSLCQYRAR